MLWFFKRIKVDKFSGYKFLNLFFKYLQNNSSVSIFSIDPNNKVLNSNKKYFKKLGLRKFYNYLAPKYNLNNLNDQKLLKKISNIKPNFIIINIGGGTQEILSLYLKKKLNLKQL